MTTAAIYTSRPINKVAARVVGRGESYDCPKKIQNIESDVPIPIRATLSGEDLTGRRQGRLTAIGLARDHKGLWVMRCDCGRYCLRRAKAVKNVENWGDRCEHCRHLAYLQKAELFRRTGKSVDINQF